jgi:hypothetical protein
MPRLQASSASSRGVQWLIGRSDASGGSQARAMIWHHCAALKVVGAPGRGASWRRSGTAQPGRLSQWRRQRRTVVRVVPRRRATAGAVRPAANRRITWARKLRCWGGLWARIIGWSAWRSSSESGTAGSLYAITGVAKEHSSPTWEVKPIKPTPQCRRQSSRLTGSPRQPGRECSEG